MSPAPAIRSGQRRVALLAVASILFQAILFGWHYHDLQFAGRLAHAVASAPSGASPSPPDADGCEICQTLHHQGAVTPEALFAPAPPPLAASPEPHDADSGTIALAFRARAPPLR